MANAVHKRFPDHFEAIETILKKDATFREICADYEEVSAWLADHCRSEGFPSEKCDHARELIRDLEGEIIKALTPFPGVGGTGEICGGITGSLITFGLYFGTDNTLDVEVTNKVISTSQKFMAYFEDAVGHLYCADIIETVILGKRINPGDSEEAMMTFSMEKGFEKCGLPPGLGVRLAAEFIIDSME